MTINLDYKTVSGYPIDSKMKNKKYYQFQMKIGPALRINQGYYIILYPI